MGVSVLNLGFLIFWSKSISQSILVLKPAPKCLGPVFTKQLTAKSGSYPSNFGVTLSLKWAYHS